ncbi:acyl-CoA dehydrogenase family protein [Actinomadura rugatobispora]|uniref:Acyl-CoA dehydrogenase family protein n=1 Tax=Actinomadura rugatobispora TaxID=1994 RepID=A0ABW0ZPP3_9ACTN|nr:acyl-CoA dehydrogenase family protein [Actinomadura rugatobispora]
MTVDPALADMMASVFSDHDPASPTRPLWDTLESLGLTRLTTPAERGGSGAGWPEAAALLRAAASHGVSLPLAENDLLANWLLTKAGLPSDGSLRTACVLDGDGIARAVPWARDADRIAVLWDAGGGWRAADVPASSVRVDQATNLAGEARDDVHVSLEDRPGVPVGGHLAEEFTLRGALARSLQMTGAMDGVLRLTIEHATTRTQFGRPLARFQAVQHLIADMAAETSLARAATDAAVHGGPAPFTIAVATSCARHAAATVVRNAHQVHGAIGTTIEHPLHAYTLRALAWRSEFGSVHDWDERVAAAALTTDKDLWDLVSSPS